MAFSFTLLHVAAAAVVLLGNSWWFHAKTDCGSRLVDRAARCAEATQPVQPHSMLPYGSSA